MQEESGFKKTFAALSKSSSPSLKGIVVDEEKDSISIQSGTSVFRIPRQAISKEEKTAEGVSIILNEGAKIVKETLVDTATIGVITEGVFGAGIGGLVARDCDCKCLCDCKCDCDCRCLCDDSQLDNVIRQVEQLARFGQLTMKLTPNLSTTRRSY